MLRKQSSGQVFRITGARQGLAEDVRGRQRRYVISMSIRTLAVIAAVVLWNVERHVAIVALVLGATLPYIAVVIANAGRENAPSLPPTFVPIPAKPMIAPPQPDDSEESVPQDVKVAETVPEDVTADPGAGLGGEPRKRT